MPYLYAIVYPMQSRAVPCFADAPIKVVPNHYLLGQPVHGDSPANGVAAYGSNPELQQDIDSENVKIRLASLVFGTAGAAWVGSVLAIDLDARFAFVSFVILPLILLLFFYCMRAKSDFSVQSGSIRTKIAHLQAKFFAKLHRVFSCVPRFLLAFFKLFFADFASKNRRELDFQRLIFCQIRQLFRVVLKKITNQNPPSY